MTRCTECNDYPAGTVCSYSGCPGKQRRPIAPQISDGDGCAAEVTNGGGDNGIIARRECAATTPPNFEDGLQLQIDRKEIGA